MTSSFETFFAAADDDVVDTLDPTVSGESTDDDEFEVDLSDDEIEEDEDQKDDFENDAKVSTAKAAEGRKSAASKAAPKAQPAKAQPAKAQPTKDEATKTALAKTDASKKLPSKKPAVVKTPKKNASVKATAPTVSGDAVVQKKAPSSKTTTAKSAAKRRVQFSDEEGDAADPIEPVPSKKRKATPKTAVLSESKAPAVAAPKPSTDTVETTAVASAGQATPEVKSTANKQGWAILVELQGRGRFTASSASYQACVNMISSLSGGVQKTRGMILKSGDVYETRGFAFEVDDFEGSTMERRNVFSFTLESGNIPSVTLFDFLKAGEQMFA